MPMGMTTIMATGTRCWLAVIAVLTTSLAQGGELSEVRDCFGKSATPAKRIEQCTVVIHSMSQSEDVRMMALYNRGLEYRAQGRYAQAIEDQSEVLRRHPQYQPSLVARASALLEQGNVPGALADLDSAIALDPRDPLVWHNRGVANRKAGRTTRAIRDFSEALRLDPSLREAWNGRGAAHQAQEDHRAAIADFDAALRLDAQSSNALNNRGISWRALGNVKQALADFDRALELNPRYAVALANRGATLRSVGQLQRARMDLDAAIAADPTLGVAYFNRGVLELRESHLEQSIADLSAAADRQSDGYAELWLYLVRSRMGEDPSPRLARSMEHLTIGQWPQPIALYLLGRVDKGELFRKAGLGTARERKSRQCEAQFFFGEQMLVQRRTSLAIEALRVAVATCPEGYVEKDHATAELAGLGVNDRTPPTQPPTATATQ